MLIRRAHFAPAATRAKGHDRNAKHFVRVLVGRRDAVNCPPFLEFIAASIGEIVTLFSRSPAHKHFSLADIEWMVLPPVLLGQFYVAEFEDKARGFQAPAAVVTWALVSAEVDARLAAHTGGPLRLRPDEWKSGDIAWLIDAVGAPVGVGAAFKWLSEGPFRERPLKIRETGEGSEASVGTLAELMAMARAPGRRGDERHTHASIQTGSLAGVAGRAARARRLQFRATAVQLPVHRRG